MKIAIENNGCPKNLVDAELMAGALKAAGYSITLDREEAHVVIINTCSFIHDAEVESVHSILDALDGGKKVIVTGCLPQKHGAELKKAIPEISAMLGTCEREKIVEIVNQIKKKDYIDKVSSPDFLYPEGIKREHITVGSSVYIKIADGCDYGCGYCIIPKLRGAYHSRSEENIVKEAKAIIKDGASEIILIAQDTTSYGKDLYGEYRLPSLLKKLNAIEGEFWIRVMYTYPSLISEELIDTIADCEKAVKYIDVPLQHSDRELLKLMNRPTFDYETLIKKIRERIPNVVIRTSLIVGYPSETDEQFENLCKFVKRIRFDKMGVFEFSREKGTSAYTLKPQVSDSVKRERYNKLMLLQQEISREINEDFVGKSVKCLVEAVRSDGVAEARTQGDAPDVDGMVYIKDSELIAGEFVTVKITAADEYDLFSEQL